MAAFSGLAVNALYARLLDLVFPPRCPGCRARGVLLCSRCVARCRALRLAEQAVDRRRGGALLATAAGLYQYDAPLREAIYLFKYRHRRAMAGPLSALMIEALPAEVSACEAIVPVPLYASRLRERGFNQSTLLAEAVGAVLGLPVDERLSRLRETQHQVGSDSHQREANVRDAFGWGASGAAPRVVLLIDDVLTTGATMRACARALRAAGTQVVHGLALATG
jgi:ComF family protein